MEHFQVRHTYDNFDFSDIKAQNTMWPPGTGKPQIDGFLGEALDQMDAAGVRHAGPAPFMKTPPPPALKVGGGIEVQLGTEPDGAGGREITQFFPKKGTGVDTFLKAEMRAIRKVLTGK